MAGYIGSGASVVSSGAENKKVFDITTNTTSLTGLNYTVGKVHVYHNGVRLVDGTDFTATNSTSIALTVAAVSGDQVVVVSFASFQVAGSYTEAEADSRFVNDPSSVITVDGSNVGIGTSSPAYNLDVSASNAVSMIRTPDTTSATLGLFVNSGSNGVGTVSVDNGGHMTFDTGATGAGQTERMRIDASGRVTKPNQPSFAASKNNGHLSSGTFIYNDVKHNVGNHYNSSNGRFTAPVTGRYFIGSMLMSMNGATYNNTSYIIAKNGTMFQRAYSSSGGAFHHQFQWSGIVSLSASDYVTIVYSNAIMYGVDSSYSWFSGHLLG